MRHLLPIILGLFILTAPPVSGCEDCQVIASGERRIGPLLRTEWTVQAGEDPLNQFKMIRLVRREPEQPLEGSLLFLPPAGFTFTFYEQRDEAGSFGSSIAEFFAARHYDVYGYSPRMDGIPAGACEAGAVDCSAMAGWGTQSMVDDVSFIRSWIEDVHPGSEVFVGGFSMGALLTFAVVNAHPEDYAGIFPWDGFLFSEDSAVVAYSAATCEALEAALAAGIVYDGVTFNFFQQLGKVAEQAPSAPTPIRLLPPVLSNHQALVATLSIPTPGPLSMPVPGYILAAGDLAEDRLSFASESRIFESTNRLYDYFPLASLRDWHCSIAGLDDSFTANLGSFTGPVLAIGAGHGWGAYMEDQLAVLGSTRVSFLFEPEFGHVDHFWSKRHRLLIEQPILRWLQRVAE
jgi:pimeloyl-ACP methyl ester carboxylesterase